MKILLVLITSMMMASSGINVDNGKFPAATLKNLDGEMIKVEDITSKHKKTIISFWASWCKPCKSEMDAIAEYYEEWQEDYDVEFIAITIDNARGLAKVPAIVTSKGWNYTFLSDPNQELQQALNFQTIPQTFVVDRESNIIYAHNGYTPGDELELEKVLKD
ncbi:TlpA family protein disulfide reductase [Portibacter marinus]|uniref:TlpA family protein disulfide reductase n=1 Tax=Portibacter marinus TaxID=2898660 RepID=UPI001F2D1195|nr:TlpA disulfide reductase family protein [Portibacter marinus]